MRSFVDENNIVDQSTCIVSLVAKPQGKNPEHAFILVEGLTKNEIGEERALFRRYDFVTDLSDNQNRNFVEEKAQIIKKHEGIVIMKEYACAAEDRAECKDFFWSTLLKDVDQVQGCQGISWPIASEKATLLHQHVEASKKKPPSYQISGRLSFFAASSSQSGHNCYTWAVEQLCQLEIPLISTDKRLQLCLTDFFVAQTTRHLLPPKDKVAESNSPGCRLM